MVLSPATAEARVIALLQEERALEMEAICARAACCRMTAFRGLKRYGYFTSYNCNSGYYTLRDIPEFDRRGLWRCGPARFSRHGTIAETVLAWVQESQRGLGLGELEEGLGVDVHCHTGELVRSGRLARTRVGKRVVYVSAVLERGARQEALRREEARQVATGSGLALPKGLTAAAVLRLLVEMIRAPEASAASLARRVSGEGERLTAEAVRTVIAFWKLDEKRGTCR